MEKLTALIMIDRLNRHLKAYNGAETEEEKTAAEVAFNVLLDQLIASKVDFKYDEHTRRWYRVPQPGEE